jgi:hypothetical protein
MPRRNRRPNERPQSRRNWWSDVPPEQVAFTGSGRSDKPRPALLPHVPTVGTCPLKSRRYGSPEDAAEALRRALINREILQSPVVEERWYPQPGDAPCVCQGYHLTSSPRRAR